MLIASLHSMNNGWRRLLKTQLWISFDFFQKTFFQKFELLNSGCGLSAGLAYLQVFTVSNKTMNKVTTNNQFKLQFYLIQKFSEINGINSWIPKFCQAVAGLIVKDIHVTQIDL